MSFLAGTVVIYLLHDHHLPYNLGARYGTKRALRNWASVCSGAVSAENDNVKYLPEGLNFTFPSKRKISGTFLLYLLARQNDSDNDDDGWPRKRRSFLPARLPACLLGCANLGVYVVRSGSVLMPPGYSRSLELAIEWRSHDSVFAEGNKFLEEMWPSKLEARDMD